MPDATSIFSLSAAPAWNAPRLSLSKVANPRQRSCWTIWRATFLSAQGGCRDHATFGARSACTVLMHADDRRVDHLYSGVMSAGQCAHDPGPYARSSPANEAVVASGVRTERIRQRENRPRTQQMTSSCTEICITGPLRFASQVFRARRPIMENG